MVHTVINSIFIPGDVPSSKNSKTWTGKFLVSSKACTRYKKNTTIFYANKKHIGDFKQMLSQVEKPYRIAFCFVRETKRLFDYINMAQIVQDLMVEHGWLTDDNCNEVIPSFRPYIYNKQNPGVHIEVIGADLNMIVPETTLTTTASINGANIIQHYE